MRTQIFDTGVLQDMVGYQLYVDLTIYSVISSQGSTHNGSLLHSRLNTQLLITVHSSSKNLTPV
jgi:hypothetical protein